MFTAVYINHPKLTPVTKLYHLRNKTIGEAGAIVKRYPLSHDNFDLAWEALKTRYENKRVLVDNQIRILFDIPSAKNEDSESIRRIQSSVNDSLATLKSLGIEVSFQLNFRIEHYLFGNNHLHLLVNFPNGFKCLNS